MKNRLLSAVLFAFMLLPFCLPARAAAGYTEVIPCTYDSVKEFSEGLVAVKRNDKWGYVDKTGAVVVPLEYDDADPFSEGLAVVRRNWQYGFIDKTGAVVVPLGYDDAGSFSEGLAVVRRNWRYGFIDKTGAVVVPLKYDGASAFSEGLAQVERGGKFGFIDKTGQLVVPCIYDAASSTAVPEYRFSEGLRQVQRSGKFGFIDKSGQLVVPCIYDEVWNFHEGLAAVKRNGKWGYIAVSGVQSDLNDSAGTGRLMANESGTAGAALTKPQSSGAELYAKQMSLTASAGGAAECETGVTVNGRPVELQTYAFSADSNGEGANFVKLRDVAAVLDGTGSQCNVDWQDNAIHIVTSTPYTTRNGKELQPIAGADNRCGINTAPILFDGITAQLKGIVITDADGGDHTFVDLKDLSEVIGFTVDWSAEQGVVITTE